MRMIIAVPLLLVLALNAGVVAAALRLRGAEGRLAGTRAAAADVRGIVAELSAAEAALGIYASTREPGLIEAFDRTVGELPPRVKQLQEFFAGAEAQGGPADLHAASSAHLEVLARMRDAVAAGAAVPGELASASARERRRVRAAAAEILLRGDEYAARQEGSVRALHLWLLASAGGGALAGLVCAALAMVTLRSSKPRPAFAPEPRVPRAAPGAARPPAKAPSGPVSVLVVDDERPMRDLLQRMVSTLGFEVRQAADAQSALAAVAQSAPTVILCDIHMPGRDGVWLADRVREISPRTAIVFATGDDEVPPFETLKTGVVAYVLKPFRREHVVSAVQQGVRWAAAQEGRSGAANAAL